MGLVAHSKITAGINGGSSSGVDTTGATLLIIHLADYDLATSTVSDNKGNTYTGLTAQVNNGEGRLYYCNSPTVGSGHTITVSGTGIYASAQFAAFSGYSAFDKETGSSTFDSSIQPGSLTAAEDGSLLIAGIENTRTDAPSINSGFTVTDYDVLVGGSYFGGALAYLEQATAAAVNPLWTFGAGGSLSATFAIFEPAAGGGGQTVAIGQPSESDAAQALSTAQRRALAQAVETDAAQAFSAAQRRGLGQASETDAAPPIASAQAWALGQPLETDAAQPIAARQARTIGQPAEADAALAMSGRQAAAVGQAAEADAAQALTQSGSTPLGLAAESDQAQPIGALQVRAIGQASEVSTAQPLTVLRTQAVGLVLEIDVAQPLGIALRGHLGAAAEADAALAMTVVGGGEAALPPLAYISAARRLRNGVPSGRPRQLSTGRRPPQ